MPQDQGASASGPGCEASPSAAQAGVFAESHPSRGEIERVVEQAIMRHVRYTPHPWDIAREGFYGGITAAAQEVARELIPASDNRWIKWPGGNCPVALETLVDIRFNNGAICREAFASAWTGGEGRIDFWRRQEAKTGYIVAYRVCDSDGSPEGQDAQRLDGKAATARAEGIAQPSPPSIGPTP